MWCCATSRDTHCCLTISYYLWIVLGWLEVLLLLSRKNTQVWRLHNISLTGCHWLLITDAPCYRPLCCHPAVRMIQLACAVGVVVVDFHSGMQTSPHDHRCLLRGSVSLDDSNRRHLCLGDPRRISWLKQHHAHEIYQLGWIPRQGTYQMERGAATRPEGGEDHCNHSCPHLTLPPPRCCCRHHRPSCHFDFVIVFPPPRSPP